MPIYRFVFRVYPMPNHPTHFPWQMGRAFVFVGEESRSEDAGLAKARAKLKQERWNVVEYERGDMLVEDRVRAEGGGVWRAYEEAVKTGVFLKVFMEGIFGDKQNPMLPRVPKITEAFIDRIIERMGGRRLTAKECNNDLSRNADYLIDDRVWELKILEEEGLEVDTRQSKLAELFHRPVGPYSTIELDPSTLSEKDRRRYVDIVGGPLKNAIKSASKQIRSTKDHLRRDDLRGGVIVVNTGYGSLHPDLLLPMALRYAEKDTSQVKDVIAISTSLEPGKAFEGTVYFQCDPKNTGDQTVDRFEFWFQRCVEDFMTDYMISGMQLPGKPLDPTKPIAFDKHGIVFATIPKRETGA